MSSITPTSNIRPIIVIDSREQTPLVFSRMPSVRGALMTGDYSIKGLEELFAIERKTVNDLANCCVASNRDRFERALHRLRGYRFKRLLIVGARVEVEQHRYQSNVSPKAIMHTLAAFEVRYDLPVTWAANAEKAAGRVETWAWWFSREMLHQARLIQHTPALDDCTPAKQNQT